MGIWQKHFFKFFSNNGTIQYGFIFEFCIFHYVCWWNFAIEFGHNSTLGHNDFFMEFSKFYVMSYFQGHVIFNSGQAFWRH